MSDHIEETSLITNDAGQLASQHALSDLVHSTFPSEHFVYAFGYGSGVFSQSIAAIAGTTSSSSSSPGMLDMIFVVRNAQDFHAANQLQNPQHYTTWLRTLDQSVFVSSHGRVAAGIQRRFLGGRDAKVLFHVIDQPLPLKYGVIEYKDFIKDLTQWESLYIAGRLHKPTLEILSLQNDGDGDYCHDELCQAQSTNLQAAVAAAMLLSPVSSSTSSTTVQISWLDLYSHIAALSYSGDFRMKIGGEDPHKIQKLVEAPGQLERFHTLYRKENVEDLTMTPSKSVLHSFHDSGLLSIQNQGIEWDPLDVSARTQLIQRLPMNVKKPLLVPSTTTSRQGSTNPVQNHLMQQQASLTKKLESIVAPTARYQSTKGIVTFGLRKSIAYASAKLAKGLFRKR